MTRATIDGNEAAASVAYRLNEVCCIYPITPSSTMAELADEWSSKRRTNVWGTVPAVVEMQSEGGAAGALHGALQGGALSTTFTASQGLLLMIPNMYKIAGELTPAVMHVAARSLAAQGLSIFGDHSDVMAVRQTGFAMLASASVQEAHDLALVAQAATLATRVPFVHFFDGFRTSHELNTIEMLSDDDLRALVPEELVRAHRDRALSPERPFIRGTAQNPDVYFQARETVNPFYARIPDVVEDAMTRLGERTGRRLHIVDYTGHPDAERVLVVMGSGAETVRETVASLNARGERVGVVQVRLYRPFPARALVEALPASVRRVAVLDRTKEPGSIGEPLFLDVVAALTESHEDGERRSCRGCPAAATGCRRRSSPRAWSPGCSRSSRASGRGAGSPSASTTTSRGRAWPTTRRWTSSRPTRCARSSSAWGRTERSARTRTRSRSWGPRRTCTPRATSSTTRRSRARRPCRTCASGRSRSGRRTSCSTRASSAATSSGCSTRSTCSAGRRPARRCCSTAGTRRTRSGMRCRGPSRSRSSPRASTSTRSTPARSPARSAWPGGSTSCCRPASSPSPACCRATRRSPGSRRRSRRPTAGAAPRWSNATRRRSTRALEGLHRIEVPDRVTATRELPPPVPAHAPEFVRTVTAEMMAGRGDDLPVSALPVDGTYPSGTTAYEKRNISELVAVWDSDLCIQCGNCSFVCPHSVIRSRYYDPSRLEGAPEGFRSAPLEAPGLPDSRYTLQVYVEDCTGCGLCVEACPVVAPGDPVRKAINLGQGEPLVAAERESIAFFETLPASDRSRVDFGTVRGTQFLEPLFEFSGACAGCGETPYIKLLSQLFGDRLMVANATGCSSIYGGNLPTTPWTTDADGRGPAWSNSLFEDNAEFGLGFRLAADGQTELARRRLAELRDVVGAELVDGILEAPQLRESELRAQRERVAELMRRLDGLDGPAVTDLVSVVDHLVRRSVWIVGGDGWAYDIGSGGLDHVLASGRNVNVLVLDTEVYSNTGGQMSKATPLGAVAKFAAAGKTVPKKDIALQAIAYGNVYVARVAMGADPQQTLGAFREAEAYDGPSLVIAYSHCIAHGIEMRNGLDQQYRAVASGYWPLIRYDPMARAAGGNPFLLDSPRPRIPLADYTNRELRYRSLANTDPAEAERLHGLAEQAVAQRWEVYEEMATRGAHRFPADARKDR